MAVWKVMRCMEGYVAVWKVMWLYGRLCGCLEGYVAVWKVMWLYGRLCGCLEGYMAVWLGYMAVWLGYVAVWLGYVAVWRGSGLDLARIWRSGEGLARNRLGSGYLERNPRNRQNPRNPLSGPYLIDH